MLQLKPTGALGILIVGEAPNWDDTYHPRKGHITYDPNTDPTGQFMHSLLTDEVGLRPDEISDVLFTNAALCLPSQRDGKYPVGKKQMDLCRPWLVRLIEDTDVKVVVTMGAVPLRALNHIERHRLVLRSGVGKLHSWFGRMLLPLYHAGLLGRRSRSAEQQRVDIRPLRQQLGR
jgi:uracil-DNA glycosylase family 4